MRVLIILSGDYGELGMANYFVAGQTFAKSAIFLSHLKLCDAFAPGQSTVRMYSGIEEIIAVVNEIKPDVVMMFSGYLLALNRLLSITALKLLLALLAQRNIKVVTSDPFCGMSARVVPWMFDFAHSGIYNLHWRQRCLAPVRGLIACLRLRRVHGLFRNLVHIYPGPVPAHDLGYRWMTFYNPEALNPKTSLPNSDKYPAAKDAHKAKPSWLFILSEIDLIIQEHIHGPVLAAWIGARLSDAWKQGRVSTLIAPARLLKEVKDKLESGVDTSFCESLTYDEFVQRLFDCEFVFYWNVFSFTSLLRILNGQTVFFFDKGHLSRGLHPYFDLARKWYLNYKQPVFFSVDRELLLPSLITAAAEFAVHARSISQSHQSSPGPEKLLEELIQDADWKNR